MGPDGTSETVAVIEATSRRNFRGWKVVIASAVVMCLQSSLVLHAFGHYAVVLQQQFGWSRTTFSVAYSLNRSESALLGPVQGWAVDRFGAGTVMRIGLVVLAVGFVCFSLVQTPLQFIGAFVVMAVGSGLSGFLTVTTTVVRWFQRRRARALAISSAGMALGGLTAPLLVWLLQNVGWRTTAAASAVVVLVIGLPLCRYFTGDPASHGEAVDGIRADQIKNGEGNRRPDEVQFTASQALRTRAFWMISLGHAAALLVVGSVLAHLPLFLTTEQNLTLQEASIVAAGLPLLQVSGQIVSGVVGDQVSKRLLAGLAMLGHTVGLLLLTFATNRWMIWMFVLFHGLAWGVRGPLMHALRADYFGTLAFGKIMGISSIILTLGVVGGPLLAGILADVTGSYRVGFSILAAVTGMGAVFFALAAPPVPPARGVGAVRTPAGADVNHRRAHVPIGDPRRLSGRGTGNG